MSPILKNKNISFVLVDPASPDAKEMVKSLELDSENQKTTALTCTIYALSPARGDSAGQKRQCIVALDAKGKVVGAISFDARVSDKNPTNEPLLRLRFLGSLLAKEGIGKTLIFLAALVAASKNVGMFGEMDGNSTTFHQSLKAKVLTNSDIYGWDFAYYTPKKCEEFSAQLSSIKFKSKVISSPNEQVL